MKRAADSYGGISPVAAKKAIGRTWAQWMARPNQAGARKLPPRVIAQLLDRKHRLTDWWGQMVTDGYNQARGLRVKHQKADRADQPAALRTFLEK